MVFVEKPLFRGNKFCFSALLLDVSVMSLALEPAHVMFSGNWCMIVN